MHPELSVIIVNYKSWHRLEACLQSLRAQAFSDLQVIVADNHSEDDRIFEFREKFPDFVFQDLGRNGGFAWACNAGASLAKGNWLLFLNPDTILSEQNLRDALAFAGSQPKHRIFSIRQWDDNGKNTHPYGMFLHPGNLWGWQRAFIRLLSRSKTSRKWNDQQAILEPEWLSGSFILIRREDFLELGGWDAGFWMYCEDMDLCRRAANRGWTCALSNEVSCRHSHGGSSRLNPDIKAMTKSEVIMSTHRYLDKHLDGWSKWLAQGSWFLGNLFSLLIGSLFSSNKRKMLGHMAPYWTHALQSGVWESPRVVSEPFGSEY